MTKSQYPKQVLDGCVQKEDRTNEATVDPYCAPGGWCPTCNPVTSEAIPDEDPIRPPLTHVAIRFRDQIWSLPRPYRHHHVIRLIIWATDNFGAQDVSHVDAYDDDQGFLDASGRYLNRKQAEVSAWLNKQLKNDRLIGSVLTSEDLW